MNKFQKIALVCYIVPALTLFIVGTIYTFQGEFMRYHSVAVQLNWEDVPGTFQVLITALMRAFGGVSVALSFAIFLILVFPFRSQEPWADWAIPAILIVANIGSFYAMSHVLLNTEAQPPVEAAFVSLIFTLLGLLFSIRKNR
ncbi:hypothetical protein K6Q96_10980 [Grimontia kaedaensis]|uniref:Uncharacterized protein n=1 Tax=Grimontia kaedaensis TaxID=2872157 RepID=A0ABY4WQX0_9GAMM|nr:hypothetical protein [Grimontia kaedaensis]USH01435.1 hypothetical protein K6Q96_10980 [Grimontia kaedaensis]